jgi:general L-amino acid transport system permease protein
MSRSSAWGSPKLRGWLLQGLLALALAGFAWFIADNAATNLARRNMPFGAGFFGDVAGFDIPFALISWSTSDTFGRAILVGLLNTGLVIVLGIAAATLLGFTMGIMRLSPNWLARTSAGAFVEVIRNTPALLQVIFWYLVVIRNLPPPRESLRLGDAIFLNVRGLFVPRPDFGTAGGSLLWGLLALLLAVWFIDRRASLRMPRRRPAVTALAAVLLLLVLPAASIGLGGIDVAWDAPQAKAFGFSGGMALSPELVALVLGLSVYTSAFIAEIVRSGILAVGHGQIQAGQALGLRRGQVLRLVTIPQAMRVIIPQLTSQYLNLAKGSSLAVAIAYPDVVQIMVGSILNRTGQAIEIMGLTMGLFLALSLLISALMNWYNRRMALVER